MSSTAYTFRLRLSLEGMLATLVQLDERGEVAESLAYAATIRNGLEFMSDALSISLSDADAILLGVEMRHEDEVDVGITPCEYSDLAKRWADVAAGTQQAA